MDRIASKSGTMMSRGAMQMRHNPPSFVATIRTMFDVMFALWMFFLFLASDAAVECKRKQEESATHNL